MLNLIDDYEKQEKAYFGLEKPNNENYKRIYEMSRIKTLSAPENINFRHIVTLVQIYKNGKSLLDALNRSGYDRDHIDSYLQNEIDTARYWLETYAPETIKFSLIDTGVDLNDQEKSILKSFSDAIENVEWTSEDLHNTIHDIIGKYGITPKNGFSLFYRVFIGKERGPRLGYFMYNLGRDYVHSRISSVI